MEPRRRLASGVVMVTGRLLAAEDRREMDSDSLLPHQHYHYHQQHHQQQQQHITGFPLYCSKNFQDFSGTFQNPLNIFPELCRSRAMFKYTNSNYLLYIYSVTVQSITEQ